MSTAIKTLKRVVLTADVQSPGGRFYPEAVLRSMVEKMKPLVESRRLLGGVWGGPPPEHHGVKLTEVTHLVTELYMEGPNLVAKVEFLETPKGKALVDALEAIYDDKTLYAGHASLVPDGIGTVRMEGDREVVETYNLVSISVKYPEPIAAVRAENEELHRLMDVQHKRVTEAIKLWQEETGQFLVHPDLGKLVEWLMLRASEAERENAELLDQHHAVQVKALDLMSQKEPGSEWSKAFSTIFAMANESSRGRSALYEELQKLKSAVRTHARQLDDDRCWLDDQQLYAAAGVDCEDASLPPKEEFLANCARYHASRQSGQPYTTVAEKMEKLLTEVLNIVRDQPYAADTKVGTRQQWVKDEIARKVLELKERKTS